MEDLLNKNQSYLKIGLRSTLVGLVVKDLELSLLWLRFQSLAQEIPHTAGTTKKKKGLKRQNQNHKIFEGNDVSKMTNDSIGISAACSSSSSSPSVNVNIYPCTKNTFLRTNILGEGITAVGRSTEIRKDALKKVRKIDSQYLIAPPLTKAAQHGQNSHWEES